MPISAIHGNTCLLYTSRCVYETGTIDTTAAATLGDLDSFIPGLEVSDGQPTQTRFKLRGLSTDDIGIGTDPTAVSYTHLDVYKRQVLRSTDTGTDADGGLTLDKVRLVETRLLVRRASGWLALPYVWNACLLYTSRCV